MLFFNYFYFCDLSEIFFDGLCAFLEFFFPHCHLQIISVLLVSVLHLACSFCLAQFLIFVYFSS